MDEGGEDARCQCNSELGPNGLRGVVVEVTP